MNIKTIEKTKTINNYIYEHKLPMIFLGFVGGIYKNRDTHLIFKCLTCDNELPPVVNLTYRRLVHNHKRCPFCTSNTGKYTKIRAIHAINKKIKSDNLPLKFIDFVEWKENNPKLSKCVFKLNDGRLWNTPSLTSFLHKVNGQGISIKLKPEEERIIINEIIHKNNMNIKFIKFEEWDGCNTKIVFKCDNPNHESWNTTNISSFKHQQSGCPLCASYGYNKDKPGYLYIQHIYNNTGTYYKFGITNVEPNYRMKQQQSGSIFNHDLIFLYYFENGNIPFNIEKSIKDKINCSVITKDVLKNGFTETIYEYELINVLDIIYNHKDFKK